MPKIIKVTVPFSIPVAPTGQIERKQFDIPYANTSPTQKLDIYWPATGNAPFPAIIAIHGGAFMGGDKRDVQILPMLSALKRGYAVIGINYRMSGEALFPALVEDIKAAIRWLRGNAENLSLDPNRFACWGGSAGGYLALMAGVSAGINELTDLSLGHPDQPENVQAVVAWYPPTDFLKMDTQLSHSGFTSARKDAHNARYSPESLILGEKITRVPDLVRMANPESYVRAGLPPFFLQHGTHDSTVPYQQSMNFAAKLQQVSTQPVIYELLLNAAHADPAFEKEGNVNKILNFLDNVLENN